MSTRTIPEIQNEYQNLCLKAGHLQYQVTVFQGDLDLVNKELRDLNLEAASVKAAEAKAASDAAAAAAPKPVTGPTLVPTIDVPNPSAPFGSSEAPAVT
jgi:hypothetical protein